MLQEILKEDTHHFESVKMRENLWRQKNETNTLSFTVTEYILMLYQKQMFAILWQIDFTSSGRLWETACSMSPSEQHFSKTHTQPAAFFQVSSYQDNFNQEQVEMRFEHPRPSFNHFSPSQNMVQTPKEDWRDYNQGIS